jgi:hypothetical protein
VNRTSRVKLGTVAFGSRRGSASNLSKGLFSGGLVAELLDVRGLPRVHRYEMNEPLRLATEPRDPGPPEAFRSFETYYDAESAPVRVPLFVRREAVGRRRSFPLDHRLARGNAQVWLVSPIPSDGDRAGSKREEI